MTASRRKLDSSWVVFATLSVIEVVLCLAVARWLWHGGDGADHLDHLVTTIAILLGGTWTLYQFVIKRAAESALNFDVAITTSPRGDGLYVAHIDVVLENIGQRTITALGKLDGVDIDAYESSVRYPGDLQIRRIDALSEGFAGWWPGPAPGATGTEEARSFLFEYTKPDEQQQPIVDFFMEPQEKYFCGMTYVLAPGDYLAKVVFVGTRPQEYWSRITHFNVGPKPSS